MNAVDFKGYFTNSNNKIVHWSRHNEVDNLVFLNEFGKFA